MSNITPNSQAVDGRNVVIQDVLNSNMAENKMLASVYAESIRQYVANKQQLPAGSPPQPIPKPPLSWITVPHAYTETEKLYDAAFPGIQPLVDDSQTGPPVAPQYVDPVAPPAPTAGSILHIGPYERDGEWGCMPDDNMPVGYVTRTPDGTWVKKIELSTPWGTAHVYTSKVG